MENRSPTTALSEKDKALVGRLLSLSDAIVEIVHSAVAPRSSSRRERRVKWMSWVGQ